MAQGLEFDRVVIDVDSLFEFGSFYTAISRVKEKKNIYILEEKNYTKIF